MPVNYTKFSINTDQKAARLIKDFTKREKNTFDYLLELAHNTSEKYVKSQYELYFSPANPAKYHSAIKEALNEAFRLAYIAQCLDIDLRINYELNAIEVNKF